MKFEVNKFGLSAGITGSVVFFVKNLFMWSMMSSGMMGGRMMGMMCGGMRGQMMQQADKTGAGMGCMMSFGGILWGLVIVFVFAYFAGLLFAWTYNQLSFK